MLADFRVETRGRFDALVPEQPLRGLWVNAGVHQARGERHAQGVEAGVGLCRASLDPRCIEAPVEVSAQIVPPGCPIRVGGKVLRPATALVSSLPSGGIRSVLLVATIGRQRIAPLPVDSERTDAVGDLVEETRRR